LQTSLIPAPASLVEHGCAHEDRIVTHHAARIFEVAAQHFLIEVLNDAMRKDQAVLYASFNERGSFCAAKLEFRIASAK
jgi:hypothetical protein